MIFRTGATHLDIPDVERVEIARPPIAMGAGEPAQRAEPMLICYRGQDVVALFRLSQIDGYRIYQEED